MESDIKVYELKRVDLKDAVVIDGFPSVGLVSSIVTNYIINMLQLEQIGLMDSGFFPTVSLIRDSQPYNPVRIYAGQSDSQTDPDKVVAFISEFQPPPNLIKPIASTMLDWAIEQRCKMLISPEGLVIERAGEEGDENGEENDGKSKATQTAPPKKEADEPSPGVYGISSTDATRKMLKKYEIKNFEEGVITGVAGVLLNEGKRRDFNVVSLLAEAHPDYPDARAAAHIIEALNKILLHTDLDAQPLYAEAEKVETHLMSIHKQTESAEKHKMPPRPPMYG